MYNSQPLKCFFFYHVFILLSDLNKTLYYIKEIRFFFLPMVKYVIERVYLSFKYLSKFAVKISFAPSALLYRDYASSVQEIIPRYETRRKRYVFSRTVLRFRLVLAPEPKKLPKNGERTSEERTRIDRHRPFARSRRIDTTRPKRQERSVKRRIRPRRPRHAQTRISGGADDIFGSSSRQDKRVKIIAYGRTSIWFLFTIQVQK